MHSRRQSQQIRRELRAAMGPEWRQVGNSWCAPEWITAGGGAEIDPTAGEVLRETPGKRTWRGVLPSGLPFIAKQHTYAPRRGRASRTPEVAALAEALAALQLRAAGFEVPRPLAWSATLNSSWVVLEAVAAEVSLEQVLAQDPEAVRERLDEVACLLARLHEAGFHHRDFYLCHLLVRDEDHALVLIDLERVAKLPARARRWRIKDAAQLVFSLRPSLPLRAGLHFLVRYARAAAFDRQQTRRFIKRALRAAERIARHRPRHGAPPLGLRS